MQAVSVPERDRAWPGADQSSQPASVEWVRRLGPYRDAQLGRGVFELAITVVPFVALWSLIAFGLARDFAPALLLAIPAAGLLVRLFMIQHDCGHGSFFPNRRANDWVGRLIGVLTLTPYAYWRRTHAVHHATSAHLGKRGTGDIGTMTVSEYLAATGWRRACYRVLRNPLFLLGIAPFLLFVLKHRLPLDLLDGGKAVWFSVMGTNLAIAGAIFGMAWFVGLDQVLLVHLPILLLAASIGVWLFYVQHQFEETWWAGAGDWSFHDGALRGSSYLDLPAPLRWVTANIGIHHVHHLASRIPSYRLGEVLRDYPDLRRVGRITLRQSLSCFRLALWDEERGQLVSFREALAGRPAKSRWSAIAKPASAASG
jgi:omega-6 fatty acid desaturase (delta-12 desaturase)